MQRERFSCLSNIADVVQLYTAMSLACTLSTWCLNKKETEMSSRLLGGILSLDLILVVHKRLTVWEQNVSFHTPLLK